MKFPIYVECHCYSPNLFLAYGPEPEKQIELPIEKDGDFGGKLAQFLVAAMNAEDEAS